MRFPNRRITNKIVILSEETHGFIVRFAVEGPAVPSTRHHPKPRIRVPQGLASETWVPTNHRTIPNQIPIASTRPRPYPECLP